MAPLNWMAPEEFRAKLAKSVRPANVAIRKAAFPEVEAGDEPRTIKFILSDDSVDRDKDVVSSKGWDLTAYKANPVVLWAHDYEQLPIARAISIGVEDGKLKATAEFMPADLNPLSDTVFRMLRGGWLKGNSVGFKPKDFDYDSERKGVNFHKQELMEFSIVPVPSHPGALAEAKSAGIDFTPVRQWAVDTLVAVQKAGMPAAFAGAPQKCPACGETAAAGATNCPKCGAAMPTPSGAPAKSIAKANTTDYGNTTGPSHSRGTGDPLRDVEGCSNGQLCPKMKDQPCPLAEGCPVGKGADGIVPKRGRMISAANESKLRYATAQINSILDRLNPEEQMAVMADVAEPPAAEKAWPPGSPTAQAQTGTGFPNDPPKPQPGVDPDAKDAKDAEKPSDKITAAGTMVAFLANLAAQVGELLEKLSPTHLGGGDDEEDGNTEGSDNSSGAQRKPPFAKAVVKTIAERDGKFLVLTEDGQTLGTHATRAEALAQLGAVEANKEKSADAVAVEEFLLEIEEDVAADGIDLGDMTAAEVAAIIKTVAHESAAARVRIRRGRVD